MRQNYSSRLISMRFCFHVVQMKLALGNTNMEILHHEMHRDGGKQAKHSAAIHLELYAATYRFLI